jgi:hypothetical protein
MVFLMQAGFGMLEAGLIRAKNTCNILMNNFLDFCMASLGFFMFGYAIMFGVGNGFIGFWAPVTSGEFTENFNVVVRAQPEGTTLEQWARISIGGIQASYADFELFGTGEPQFGGLPALSHAFFITDSGKRNGVLRVIALDGNIGYELTFIAAEVDFEALLPLMDAIVASFELLP